MPDNRPMPSALRLLALETSTDTLSVALGTGAADGVVWQHSGPGGAMASTTLLPLVKQALDAAGWPLTSLDAMGVGITGAGDVDHPLADTHAQGIT